MVRHSAPTLRREKYCSMKTTQLHRSAASYCMSGHIGRRHSEAGLFRRIAHNHACLSTRDLMKQVRGLRCCNTYRHGTGHAALTS